MSITSLLAVGTGGALGAIGRWGLSLLPFRGEFPLLTLVTNLLGAVLIGFIAGWAGRGRLSSLLHLLPGEPDPAGEGGVAAGRELYGPQRGPLPSWRGPGRAAESDLNNTQPQRAATWGRPYGCYKPFGRLEGTGRSGTGPYEKNETVSISAVGEGLKVNCPAGARELRSPGTRAAEAAGPYGKTGSSS